MKGKLLLLMLLIASCASYAQNTTTSSYIVKGILVDSLTLEGEPYATIKIVEKKVPDKAVKMAVTDMQGNFKEKMNAQPGMYVITITSIGKSTVTKDFEVKSGEKEVDLGTLYTSEATNELGSVEIVAQKPLVKADIDKIEYNVQDDPDSKTNTVLEMLRKVPLVTVDGEDNIKVNGSSSFKIHVNGKPDNMMSDNPVDVLKSMPANTIKHIEVITNPGAKYDAEGVGGILNIVTVGGSGFKGYTATFTGNGSNTGGGGSLYTTIKKDKLTLSARYNYNANNSPRSYSSSTQRQTQTISEGKQEETVIQSESSSKGKNRFQSGNLEASYEIDTLRLITMGFGMYGGNNDGTGYGETVMKNADPAFSGVPYYSYESDNENDGSWYSVRGNIDYQRTSRKLKDRMFTLSYKINARPSTSNSRYGYTLNHVEPGWEDYVNKTLAGQRSDGKQNSSEHTFQADYTTPIAKIHTLETGLKYIIRNNHSDNNRYDKDENYDEDRSSHYKHLNDILAAYVSYGIKVKKFSGRAGVRYERTMQDVKYTEKPEQSFDADFNDWVPSASLGFKITDMSNIRLGYNMRIWRPSIWFLNPYLNDSNPAHVTQGNASLESEKSHAFNLIYSNFTQKFNINMSLNYSFNNNGIERVTSLMNDKDIPGLTSHTGKEVLYSTYQNIGKSSYLGLSGYVNWNASPKTRVYLNLWGDYSRLKSPSQNLENSGWSVFAYGGVQQTLPLDIRLSVNLMGSTPYISLQGKGSSYYDYSVSVNRSFLKEKRLTVSAFAGNFFKKYMKNKNTLTGDDFWQESTSRYSRQRFGVSVSYRIGELKASVKKAARSIENDDVKGGEGGGGQGGSN